MPTYRIWLIPWISFLAASGQGCAPCLFTAGAWPGGPLDQPLQVFRHLVKSLPAEVTVYPSENHYYFAFPSPEGEVRGNLWFDIPLRDSGKVALNYAVRRDGQKVLEQDVDIGPPELDLKRMAPLEYAMKLEGRVITVRMNPLKAGLPAGMKLRAGERYVGPSYDDSGLQFALLIATGKRHFLWALNEEAPVPEILRRLENGLLLGERTRFVFWEDSAMKRKILVGVSRAENRLNSTYDGPFDQLPDNLIHEGKVDLLGALKSAGYNVRGLDQYGRAKGGSIRTSITPYALYRNDEDLDTIAACTEHEAVADALACLAGRQ